MKKKRKQRLVKEYKNLLKKIYKLDKFLDKHAFDTGVSNNSYRMMRVQYFGMCVYEGALRARIEELGIEI